MTYSAPIEYSPAPNSWGRAAPSTPVAGEHNLAVDRYMSTYWQSFLRPADSANDSVESLAWVQDVYSLVAQSRPRAAIDVLFEHVDDMLMNAKFEQCASLLDAIDPKRLDTNLMVGVLAVTFAARENLPNRQSLWYRIQSRLQSVAPDRASSLIDRLR